MVRSISRPAVAGRIERLNVKGLLFRGNRACRDALLKEVLLLGPTFPVSGVCSSMIHCYRANVRL